MSFSSRVCRNIALTGFMAAGKTVVSRRLARKLGWSFVDLDRVIEADVGLSIPQIFSRHGETHFREAEKRALKQVLQRTEQVIALGGGAVLDAENLKLLQERSLLVWLKVSTDVVLRRIKNKDNRPLLQGPDKRKRIEQLSRSREGIYAQAHVTIETDKKPVEDVVEEIWRIADNLC